MTSFGRNGPPGAISSRGGRFCPPSGVGTKFYPGIDRVKIVVRLRIKSWLFLISHPLDFFLPLYEVERREPDAVFLP